MNRQFWAWFRSIVWLDVLIFIGLSTLAAECVNTSVHRMYLEWHPSDQPSSTGPK